MHRKTLTMPKKNYNLSHDKRRRKEYYDHDDRSNRMEDDSPINRPRVSFKYLGKGPSKYKNILKHELNAAHQSSNNNGEQQVIFTDRGRRNMNARRSPVSFRLSKVIKSKNGNIITDASWYKIVIPFGEKYEKSFIINSLLSCMAPNTFTPIMYKIIGQEAVFYVDNQKTASDLINCDRKITAQDGFKIHVRVRPGFPQCDVDNILKEKLKLALSKRYVQENNAIDLSQFHHDPELVDDYFCALFRPSMLALVLGIVADAIPNLEALNLDNNKLNIIEKLNILDKKFPNLKILYVGDNKIKEIHQIDVLSNLKLQELRLAGNPVCNKYKTRQEEYISDIRKRFPKLLRLDGQDLPKPIVFDVADEVIKMPPSKQVYSSNEEALKVAQTFMQQYFMIYDSDSRQPLLAAYHEQAIFSLTVAPSPTINKFGQYLSDNRNLFRTSDSSRRRKLLKQGKLPVVSYITQLPNTQHFLDSFTMDIGIASESMMLITMSGLFKEIESKDQPIRFFNRTFVIVPEGSGYLIKNEQLHMCHPTSSQEKFVNNPSPQPYMPPVPESIPSTSTGPEPTQEIQQQMVIALSKQTNMNLDWSLKCLKDVKWNYDNALVAFNEFFRCGQIPPEAFLK